MLLNTYRKSITVVQVLLPVTLSRILHILSFSEGIFRIHFRPSNTILILWTIAYEQSPIFQIQVDVEGRTLLRGNSVAVNVRVSTNLSFTNGEVFIAI